MPATLGDFLHGSCQHIHAAVATSAHAPAEARAEAAGELCRLVVAFGRLFGELPVPLLLGPAWSDLHADAVADARRALQRATAGLRHESGTGCSAHPLTAHLSAAADHLNAGRDLLQSHLMAPDADARAAISLWSPVIRSAPVRAALLAELASQARVLSPLAGQLAMTGPSGSGLPTVQQLMLQGGTRGLWLTACPIEAAQRQHPTTATASALLASIPACAAPPHRPPGHNETLHELCDGLIVSAGRLRYAALAPRHLPPAGLSALWRRTAVGSAITFHANSITFRILTSRARQRGTDPAIHARLISAADTLDRAWPAWRAVACSWDTFTTGPPGAAALTAAARDIGDLALRSRRLAFGPLRTAPKHAASGAFCASTDLSPTARTFALLTAAAHHAADAIGRVAAADQRAVSVADARHRLYMPTGLLPERRDVPYRYTLASLSQTTELHRAYASAINATADAAECLDELAVAVGAPSTLLAAARALAGASPGSQKFKSLSATQQAIEYQPLASGPKDLSPTEQLLHDLRITDPAMVLKAVAIEHARSELIAEAIEKSRGQDKLTAAQSRRRLSGNRRPTELANLDTPARWPITIRPTTEPHDRAAVNSARVSIRRSRGQR